MAPDNAPDSTAERPLDHSLDLPAFPILGNLSTDDPHWRRTTLTSALLTATAATGARHTSGRRRLVLAAAAVICSLPALSLALMISIAALLRHLDREYATNSWSNSHTGLREAPLRDSLA